MSNKGQKPTAVIYCRVSSPGQNNHPGAQSLAVQEQLCRQYCKEKGIEVKQVIQEIASGKRVSRQTRLLDVASTHDNCLLMVASVDRFSRDLAGALTLIESLNSASGIKVFSVKEGVGYEKSADKNLFVNRLAAAQDESNQISDRISASIQWRKSQGHKIGPAPFGMEAYRDGSAIRRFRPNREEQSIIDFIRKTVDKQPSKRGVFDKVASQLNKEKRLRRNRAWTRNMVSSCYRSSREMKAVKKMKAEFEKVLDDVDSV